MKKLTFLLMFAPIALLAQDGRNIIKTNLSSIALKNYSFTYERAITKRISLSLGYRFMPTTIVPLQDFVNRYLDNPSINVGAISMGNYAITPEVRFYLGKGVLHGLYGAAYGRFANFNIGAPITYSSSLATETATFSGNIKSSSGGLMIGVQHNIAKILVLDIWIIGGHYGGSSGNLVFTSDHPLNSYEQQTLLQNLKNTNTKPFEFTYTVNANGGTATSTGPWAGVRGAGINLGIRF
jgi:hypothetical protein